MGYYIIIYYYIFIIIFYYILTRLRQNFEVIIFSLQVTILGGGTLKKIKMNISCINKGHSNIYLYI